MTYVRTEKIGIRYNNKKSWIYFPRNIRKFVKKLGWKKLYKVCKNRINCHKRGKRK